MYIRHKGEGLEMIADNDTLKIFIVVTYSLTTMKLLYLTYLKCGDSQEKNNTRIVKIEAAETTIS